MYHLAEIAFWRKALGWALGVWLVSLLVINGVTMLVSPAQWFRMSPWLAARGALSRKRYSSGLGAADVRILGGVLLAVLIWIAFDLGAPAKADGQRKGLSVMTGDTLVLIGGAIIAVLGIIYGVLCVMTPQKIIRMQAKFSTMLDEQSASGRAMIWQYRIMGVIMILGGAFFVLLIIQAALDSK